MQTITLFNPLHEADRTVFEQTADDIIGKAISDERWLKKARKSNGLTQEGLSEKSGVPIRLIRAYEQGKINMENAEYGTITKLKTALNCFL